MKVVINACYGGFGLSHEGMMRYGEIKGIALYPEHDSQFPSLKLVTYWTVPEDQRPAITDQTEWHVMSLEDRIASNKAVSASTLYDRDIPRSDAALVQVVEEMGAAASGRHARLKVVEIPDDVQWEIDEYDGNEHVAEVHRTWS